MTRSTPIYLPDADADDRWNVVAAALRAAGFHDIRPAPMPSQTFRPRHVRQQIQAGA